MIIRILHKIGLTNLSPDEVRRLEQSKYGILDFATSRAMMHTYLACAMLGVIGPTMFASMTTARLKAARINCSHNLGQIGIALRVWSTDNSDSYPFAISTNQGGTKEIYQAGSILSAQRIWMSFSVMSNELSNPNVLVCPSDSKIAATDFAAAAKFDGVFHSNTQLSYGVNLGANETDGGTALFGDRNIITPTRPDQTVSAVVGIKLTDVDGTSWAANMHRNSGNIVMADGYVDHTKGKELKRIFENTYSLPILGLPGGNSEAPLTPSQARLHVGWQVAQE